jgi:Na+/proline symporter
VIDLLLVGGFVCYALWAGLRARRAASRGLEEYFLAGRSLGAWSSGFSMTATQYAADTPLLAAGLVATGGIFALWRLWIYGIAFLLLGLLLGGAWWRSRVVTDAELCELRYGGRAATALRGIKAVYYGLIFNCAVLAMVLVAAVRIAEPFLRWHEWLPALIAPLATLVEWIGVPLAADPTGADVWAVSASNLLSVLLIYAFTTAYSATGGLRGVVSTDLGQLALVAVGTAIYAAYAVDAAGGLGGMRDALEASVGALRADELLAFEPSAAADVGGTLLAVLGLQWLVQMNSDGTGYLAQRCMACRSEAEARRAPVVFAFAQIGVRSLLWLPILVALLIVFPLEPGVTAAEREYSFVRGISTLLPPGPRGLLLVGLLAALASTLDTHLNWGASYLSNDLYGRLFCGARGRQPSPRELVWVARLSSPLLMLISLALMLRLGSIQQAWHVSLLLGAGLGIPLLMRWLWWRTNAASELSAIVASGLAAPLLLATVDTEAARLLGIALVGTVAAVAAAFVFGPEDPARLDAFYERVEPPGFWRRAESRRRLARGTLAVAAASGTLFASLVGLGSWLVGGTPPTVLPHAGAWIALNLAVAAALIPVWWPLLRSSRSDSEV